MSAGSFLKQTVLVAGGTVLAQAIIICATPAITRMYSSDVVGVWALFNALALTLSVLANLRYELAVVLPERDDESLCVVVLCTLCSGSFALLIAVALFCFGDAALGSMGFGALARWKALLPLVVVLAGPYQALNYWFVRMRAFKLVAVATVSQSLASVAVQVGYALLVGRDELGLVMGTIAGYAVSVMLLSVALLRRWPSGVTLRSRLGELRALAHRYRNFPFFVTPYGFLGQLTSRALIFFAVAVASSREIAFLALAYRLTYLPVTIIGGAVRSVFFARAARELGTPAFSSFVSRLISIQLLAAAPLLVAFVAEAPDIFRWVLGPQWGGAGEYARWMAVPAVAVLLSCWLDRIYDVLGRQRLALMLEIGYDVVMIVLYASTIRLTGDVTLGLAVFAVIATAYNVFWLLFTLRISGIHAGAAGRAALLAAGVCGFFALALWVGKALLDQVVALALYVLLCGAYYWFKVKPLVAKKASAACA